MKRLLLNLLMLVTLSGFTQQAFAQDSYSVTVEWDYPGSVSLKSAGKILPVPDDATSYTVESTDKWFTVQVLPKYGYEFVSWTEPGTGTVKKSNSISGIYKFSGETVKVVFNKVEFDASFTLNVVNGLSTLSNVSFNETGADVLPLLAEGNNTIQYATAKNKKLDIMSSASEVYYVKQNGTNVSPRYTWSNSRFQVEIADGDKIEIAVFDPASQQSDAELTLTIPEGMSGCISSVRNWTAGEFIQDQIVDNKLTVVSGTDLQFNFNDKDYTVNSVTYDGSELTIQQGTYPYVRFTADKSGEVVFDVTERVYGTRTITAYVANPQGVTIIAGNGLDGVELPLVDGEVYDQAIEMAAWSESGSVIDKAFTIPAGAAQKFTLTYSLRYDGIQLREKDGYYISHHRGASLKTGVESGCTDNVIYVYAESTDPDSKAWVYYDGPAERVRITPSSAYGATRQQVLASGYQEYKFKDGYDNPITLHQGAAIDGMAVYLDDTEVKADEYGVFTNIAVKNGSVLRVFADGESHSKADVKFFLNDGATAEVTYDKVLKHDPAENNILSVYDGTEVIIKPAERCTVLFDGDEATLDAEGQYVFTADGEPHYITLNKAPEVYAGKFTLIPASGETVTSLETITISFDDATSASVVEGMESDMMLQSGNNYAAWGFEVTAVEGAPVPTFEIKPQMTPGIDGSYRFWIPTGVFTIDGNSNPEIRAQWTLTLGGDDELTYSFEPNSDEIFAGEYYSFAIVFDESKNVSNGEQIATSMLIEFNSTELTYGTDYEVACEDNNMALIMISNEAYFNKVGTFNLYMAEGALSVSGKPSPEMSHSWRVIEPINYTVKYVTDPSVAQKSLATIRIAFPEAKTAELSSEYGITLKDSKYTYSQHPTEVNALADAEYPTFDLVFDPAPSTEGTYTLQIMFYAFALDGTQTLADNVDQTFILDKTNGVDNILSDGQDGDNAVYNLQGIKLNSEWNELPAGMYIRNGKKVLKH